MTISLMTHVWMTDNKYSSATSKIQLLLVEVEITFHNVQMCKVSSYFVTMQKYPDFDHCVFPQKGLSLRAKSSAAQSAVQDATSSSQQQQHKRKVHTTHNQIFVALIYYI